MSVLLILLAGAGCLAAAWGALKGDVQAVGIGAILIGLAVLALVIPG